MKKIIKFSYTIIITGIFFFSSAWAGDEEYIKYDFSKPLEVFKATLSETVVGTGIEPAVLFKILQTGQIVIINDHPNNPDIPWLTTSGILVNAPAEQVFKAITDYDNYNEFMPQVDRAGSVTLGENIVRIDYNIGIQVLLFKVDVPYSVYSYYTPPFRVDWVLAGGKFNENLGAYEVVPVPGQPNRSMLFYTSFAENRNAIVNKLSKDIPILDMLINLSAGTIVVKALRDRSEDMYNKTCSTPKPFEEKSSGIHELIKLHPDILAALSKRGKLVILENTTPRYYTGGIIVDKSIADVYNAISDLEGSSSASDLYSMKVLSRKENALRVKAKTTIKLVMKFDTKFIANYELEPPYQMTWEQEPGGDIKGEAGSWEFVELEENKTLVLYRHTSDLKSQGFFMRRLFKIEPAFEQAIQASMVQYIVNDNKKWAENSHSE